MQKKKVYILSPAGHPNYGDEIILRNWVEYLESSHPDYDIWVDVLAPAVVSCYFREKKNVHVTNALWRLIWESPCTDGLDHFYESLQKQIISSDSSVFSIPLKNLHDIDIFHVVGGGYLNGIWPKNLGFIYIAEILKNTFGTTVYFTGHGFIPVNLENDTYLKKLSIFDHVDVRDLPSSTLLKCEIGFDDAYLNMIDQVGNYVEEEIPDVMICIQYDLIDLKDFDKICDVIAQRIELYISNNVTVGYVEAIPELDGIAFKRFEKYIPNNFFFSANDCIIKGLPIKKNQLWYSTRYHHHLIASLNNCLGVCLIGKTNYYDVKHDSLLSNGTGWSRWDLNDSILPFPGINPLFNNVAQAITKKKREVADCLYTF